MHSSFYTIADDATYEIVEKKSRFIAKVFFVKSEVEVNLKIDEVKKAHRDARHNVFAYRLENGVEKYNEDGEPQRNSRNSNFRYLTWRKFDERTGHCN